MRQTRAVEIEGRTVTVKELTVAEIRHWLKGLEQVKEAGIDVVAECLMDDCSLADISRMSDLKLEEMDDLTPGEIGQVVAVCREVNPHFFRMRDHLLGVAKVMQQNPAAISNEPGVH